MTKYKISLLIGDGIGYELSVCINKILENIHDKSSSKIKSSDACLKSPVGESAADVVLVLRRHFKLFANIRPSKNYPNIASISKNVDLITVRENTEDLYIGWEFFSDDDTVISLRKTSREASEKISRFGFTLASKRNKKKVTIVHKSNVLKKSDKLFVETAKEIAKDYTDVDVDEMYVDACSMELIRNPNRFDIILTTNLFGDIISDESAQVTGSIGLAPAANIGDDFALFEPVHGAAFDIAGKNIRSEEHTSELQSRQYL